MTQIKRMIMHGFKSFARRTELEFGDNFNCILGPNGSGKSNVIDAICFVLGKSSAKSLRAEKSSNLLFNGGKRKTGATRAEVSIVFDNDQKEFSVDSAEIKISRIIKQNGSSIYKINEVSVTRQQILDLLSQAKINPDGYNIILQGDIIHLTEMPSVERRQVIEEIAGINIYEEKKKKAMSELEKVDQQLGEADIILKERKTYLTELKKDKDQAEKYRDLNNRIKEYKASYLTKQIEAVKVQLDKNESQVKELNDAVTNYNEEIKKLKAENEEKKNQIKEINKEVEEKGEKDQIAINKEIEKTRVTIAENRTRITSCTTEIQKIKERKEQLEINHKDTQEKLKNLEAEVSAFEKQKVQKEKDLALTEEKIDQFKKKNKLEDSANIDAQIEELDKKIEEDQKRIQELREKQQQLMREKDKVEFQISNLNEQVKKVSQIEKENQEQIKALKVKKEEFKRITYVLNDALNKDSGLSAQLGNARRKLIEKSEYLSTLNAKAASAREQIAGSIAIKKIMENRKEFGGPVYGTVSELGEVAPKYAMALKSAAGARIHSIVVEDDRVAANCIKYLKQNKLGVATLLPLNKMKNQDGDAAKKFLKESGVHGEAIRLINFDSKFKNIFSYVFKDTLVIENIETARKVGIGNIKMATLDGDLVETSGAMIGGYRNADKEGVGFKERQLTEDADKLEIEVNELRKAITIMDKDKVQNETTIDELRKQKAELEGDILAQEKTLHLESSDLDITKQSKQTFDTQIKSVEKELSETQDKIMEITRQSAQEKSQKQQLRDKITALRNPRLLAELNSFEEKRTQLKESLIQINSDMKNLKSQLDNIIKPEIENAKKILNQHKKEEDDFNKEIEQLKESSKTLETSLKEKEELQKKFYSKFKELFNQRNKLSDEINKSEIKIDGINTKNREKEISMNKISLVLASHKAKMAGLEAEFAEYKDVVITVTKSEEELKKDINKFESMQSELGNVNMKALEIYESVEKEYNSLLEKKDTLDKEKTEIFAMMTKIEEKKKELFMNTFNAINTNFQRIFANLSTKGGEAHIFIENPEDIFSEGVRIEVRHAGNKFLDIRSLSGGEKTMTALAFIFAIQEYDPASFYVLDEVDAALDKHNSEKFANLIRQYSGKAQYVIISHNDAIISEATYLYGVSMPEVGISKVTSLKL